jgi:endonuclease YncB( thermonuclease family)
MVPEITRCVAVLLGLGSWLAFLPPAASADIYVASDCKLEAGPVRAVARVLDGETLRLDDGSEVRLIGALAPRGFDIGEPDAAWPPAIAATDALRGLVEGRSVALAFGGRQKDRYQRWLAHVVVERDGKEAWVQGEMLARGMARAYAEAENSACMQQLAERERPARETGLGLWLNAAYYVRSADEPGELMARRGTFQIVTGRIAATSYSHGQIWIRFGNERGSFSGTLKRANTSFLGDVDTKQLRGATATVRGWVQGQDAPSIEITAPGQFEASGAPESRAPAAGRRPRYPETATPGGAGR